MVEEDVVETDSLDREVFSQSSAKKARRNRIRFHFFRAKADTNLISVYRLDYASEEEALSKGKHNTEAR